LGKVVLTWRRAKVSSRTVSDIVAGIGNIWGTGIEVRASGAVDKYLVAGNHQSIRWLWHVGSSVLLFGAAVVSVYFELLGTILGLFWFASVGLHVFTAISSSDSRDKRMTEQKAELLPLVRQALANKRWLLTQGKPFDRASRRKITAPRKRKVDAQEAEELAADWMRILGEEGVRVTRQTKDGGVDVVSTRCVAQVKNYVGSVGVAEIRQLFGASTLDGRKPLFFTSGTYTKSAIEFAQQAKVYLYKYSAQDATLDGINSFAIESLSAVSR